MTPVLLHRLDPSQNMRRFYRLDVQPDLFGFWMLVKEWGRIGRPGKIQVVAFDKCEEAHNALQKQSSLKQKKGYAEKDRGRAARDKRSAMMYRRVWHWMSAFS